TLTQPSETKTVFTQPKVFPLFRTEENVLPEPVRDVEVPTSDARTEEPGIDGVGKSSATKVHKGFAEKGSPKKGSLEEGYPSGGLVAPIASSSSCEVLKRAFDVLPMLSPLEQLMYLWFLNMSHEVGRDSCRATMTLLQRATGISEKLVRENIRSLLRKGCLNLLDGGAAGKAALYRVALPEEAADAIIKFKASYTEGSLQEPSSGKPSDMFTFSGNLPERNLPKHIERESSSFALSNDKKPLPREPFPREGSLPFSLP